MNNVEMNNNSNPVQTKEKKKMNKLVYVIILILVVLACYFAGYFVGTKLKEDDKEKETKVIEENEQKEDDQSNEEETPSEPLLTTEEALALAKELYFKGITTHSCGGGLDLNFDSMEEIDGIEYYEVTNWTALRNLFTKSAKIKGQLGADYYYSIDEMVKEKSGKYYDSDCARGSNCRYGGTELEIVSIKSDIIVLDAISKYYEDCCGECDEKYDKYKIVSETFVIEKEDNEWKISRMIYPNN